MEIQIKQDHSSDEIFRRADHSVNVDAVQNHPTIDTCMDNMVSSQFHDFVNNRETKNVICNMNYGGIGTENTCGREIKLETNDLQGLTGQPPFSKSNGQETSSITFDQLKCKYENHFEIISFPSEQFHERNDCKEVFSSEEVKKRLLYSGEMSQTTLDVTLIPKTVESLTCHNSETVRCSVEKTNGLTDGEVCNVKLGQNIKNKKDFLSSEEVKKRLIYIGEKSQTTSDVTMIPTTVESLTCHDPETVQCSNEKTNGMTDEEVCNVKLGQNKKEKKGLFKCNYCHQTFTLLSSIKQHMNIHTGRQMVACHFCYKQLTTKSNVRKHIRNVHNIKNLHKAIASKESRESNDDSAVPTEEEKESSLLSKKENTDTHTLSTIPESNESLILVINTRKDASASTEEMTDRVADSIILTKEEKENSSLCRKENMDTHLITVTGSNESLIDTDTEALARTEEMTDYVADKETYDSNVINSTKSKKGLFKCNYCGETFTLLSSLRRHIGTHTGRQLISCPLCDRQYTRLSNVNRHLMNDHNRKNINVYADKQKVNQLEHVEDKPESEYSQSCDTKPFEMLNSDNCEIAKQRFENESKTTLYQNVISKTNENPLRSQSQAIDNIEHVDKLTHYQPKSDQDKKTHGHIRNIHDSKNSHEASEEKNKVSNDDSAILTEEEKESSLLCRTENNDTHLTTTPESNESLTFTDAEALADCVPDKETINSKLDNSTKSKKGLFKCNYCGETFIRLSSVKDHMKIHTGRQMFSYHVLNKQESNDANGQEMKHNVETCNSNSNNSTKSKNGLFKCNYCGETFTRLLSVKQHMKIHTGRQMFSYVFNKQFPTKSIMKRHIQNIHNSKNSHKTNEENSKESNDADPLTSTEEMKDHKETCDSKLNKSAKSKKGLFKCKYCDIAFAHYSSLSRHIGTHTGRQLISCPFCDKQYTRLFNLNRHLKNDHNRKNTKVFANIQKVNRSAGKPEFDQSQSCDTKPFEMIESDNCDSAKHRLENDGKNTHDQNLLSNTKEDPVRSQSQARDNTERVDKLTHYQPNSDQDKNTIGYQNEEFHREDGKLICNICEERFTLKNDVIRHLNNNTHKYPCDKCGLCFISPKLLKRHRGVKHRVIEYYATEEEKQSDTALDHQFSNSNESCGNQSIKTECIDQDSDIKEPPDIADNETLTRNQENDTEPENTDYMREFTNGNCIKISSIQDSSFNTTGDNENYESKASEINKLVDIKPNNYPNESESRDHSSQYEQDAGSQYMYTYGDKKSLDKISVEKQLDEHTGKSQFTCRECGECFYNIIRLKSHAKIVHDIMNYSMLSCTVCAKGFDSVLDVKLHMRNVHEYRNHYDENKFHQLKFPCELCEEKFLTNCDLQQHYLLCHRDARKPCCGICGEKFETKAKFLEHALTHEGFLPFRCFMCFRSFGEDRRLHRHIRTHTGEKAHHCEICGKGFNSINQRNIHVKYYHSDERPHACHLCDKRFPVPHALKLHMRRHQTDRPFVCEQCGKQFKFPSGLSEHTARHLKEKPFKCEDCGKTFVSKHILVEHMRVHTGEKPFECKICHMRFSVKQGLLIHHNRKHLEVTEMFKCDFCDQECKFKTDLKKHVLNKHTDHKPFSCEICGKKAKTKEAIKLHQSVHTGAKPFSCEICQKRFTRSFGLAKHMRAHKGERNHTCDVCGKSFIENHNLKSHMKRSHPA